MLEANKPENTRSIFVLPLGGTNRVGLNMTLIGHAGRWLLVDAGATFANADDTHASDYATEHGGVIGAIIPDLTPIASIMRSIDGIVITHAHEDHIGALDLLYRFEHLWPGFSKIPVHATPYTAELIRTRLARVENRPPVINVRPGRAKDIGPFKVEWVPVTHSAPETSALAISTTAGTIVLASDIKLDDDPVLGPRTDIARLEALGNKGVLAFLGDSTNAGRSGRSTSEGAVGASLSAIARGFTQRIFIASFASNLARAESAREAALASGRNFQILGHSLRKNLGCARTVGIIEHTHHAPTSWGHNDNLNSLVLCSGTQAEPGSALVKIADALEGNNPSRSIPLIGAGDLLIHSARIIPGNEKTVATLFATFQRRGIHVLTADSGIPGVTVHASGHAYEDEMKDLYTLLRPTFATPIHGDRHLIEAHLDLARRQPSVRTALSPEEGQFLEITGNSMKVVDKINVRTLAEIRMPDPSQPRKLAPWPPPENQIRAA